jgi:hypothetical protein
MATIFWFESANFASVLPMISEYVGVGAGAVSPLSILYLPSPWNLSGLAMAGSYPFPFFVRM